MPDVRYTKAGLLDCLTREIGLRGRVYARRVAEKKMSQAFADEELAKMRACRGLLNEYMPEDPPPPQGALFE